MFYALITIGLIVVSAFVFLPRFRTVTERYSLGVNFFLTLIATLVGVLIAILISNYEQAKKETADVVKLLHASIASIETCHQYSDALVEFYQELDDTDALKPQFYSKNPPPYPVYIDSLLTQNIVSKNLSESTLSDLNELVINLHRSRSHPALYIKVLEQIAALIRFEIQYQQGDISQTELVEKAGTLKNRLEFNATLLAN